MVTAERSRAPEQPLRDPAPGRRIREEDETGRFDEDLDLPLPMRFSSRTPSITSCSSNARTLNTLSPEPLARATSASARRRFLMYIVAPSAASTTARPVRIQVTTVRVVAADWPPAPPRGSVGALAAASAATAMARPQARLQQGGCRWGREWGGWRAPAAAPRSTRRRSALCRQRPHSDAR
uniref:Uncharacterized protein n=1 Tax=Oryza meridionalis TaxID=40149 RepID=A0A0E0C011_9ORYZ